jgi:hypothetical protein
MVDGDGGGAESATAIGRDHAADAPRALARSREPGIRREVQHEGSPELTVESRKDVGSTFRLLLPRLPDAIVDEELESRASQSPALTVRSVGTSG